MDGLKELLAMKLPVASAWRWMPFAASTQAESIDWLFYFLLWTGILLFLIVIAPMTWFVFRYRRKHEGQKALSQVDHNPNLERAWTFLPLIYLALVFYWGFVGYTNLSITPSGAKNLRVIGQKWNWTVQYPDDEISVSGQGAVIGVPVNQPVSLTMSSQDVIHSFFVPNFRIKQDVVPGRYSTIWFEAKEIGEFPVFCAEYCGDSHSNMLALIKVMPEEEFREWVAKKKGENNLLSPLQLGQKLFVSKACNTCHTTDGSPKIGPSFKGIYGHTTALESGGSVKVDDNYIRESILEPQAKIVKSYPPVMPTFKGQLSEQEINALIEFIKSLK